MIKSFRCAETQRLFETGKSKRFASIATVAARKLAMLDAAHTGSDRGAGAFVSFQDTDYEVPQELFDQFSTTYQQLQQQSQSQGDQGNLLQSLGIDPTNWLTDLSNEGTEDVEGTETVHISGQADVPKLVEDIKKIAQNAPKLGQRVTPQQLGQLDQLTAIIKSAEFDIFSGASDNLLRKIDANLELTPPAGTAGAPDSVTLEVSLTKREPKPKRKHGNIPL